MFGLFGMGAGQGGFTPGILPDDQTQRNVALPGMLQGGNEFVMPEAPKRSFGDKLFIMGGGLRDLGAGGGNNMQSAMGWVDNKLAQKAQQAERERRIKAALALAGDDPVMQAMAQSDAGAQAMMARGVDNRMLNPLAVNADNRADKRLGMDIEQQKFGMMDTNRKWENTLARYGIEDERYMDERNYGRTQDQKMWDYRDRDFNRGVMESDRNYNAMTQRGPSAPKLYDLYDEQSGQPYKAMYNPQTGGFDRVGGVKAGKAKEFSQAQSQAAGYANRAYQAEQDFQRLQDDGFDPLVNLSLPGTANRRQYGAIKDEFINAVLRKESGAAISDSEYKRAENMYFPKRTDKPDVAKQKAAARQRAIESMRAESQGAYDSMFGSGREQYGSNTDWSRYQPLPGLGMNDLPSGYLEWLASQ